ncbi:hypothetical protein N7462_000729 [Penicillium macrosclerotiorum]|uniref:uncharacterized protein n=1 Tax=Penicillium macrosclerotiorum TaxID=303699 RepID=UPI0025476BAA|nr:uncharacterized protein N7462_000729 [Penicillium macrosclerotiorum]KAJ5698724.1 hypothetical protein N7462_000729 [Penicillium macrosclerotiorum]
MGNKEPIAIKKDESKTANLSANVLQHVASLSLESMAPLAPHSDSMSQIPPPGQDVTPMNSDVSLSSEETDHSGDLPPPYKV